MTEPTVHHAVDGDDPYERFEMHLTRAQVDRVLHYTHWIPNTRGFTKKFLDEHYPGWTLAAFIGVFDAADIRVRTEPCSPHGGKCHWKVKALHFNTADDVVVEWNERITKDDGRYLYNGQE